MRTTFYGEAVAIQQGQYSLYVFKNLDEKDNSLLRYITVTRVPNWNGPDIKIGDKGYVECEYVNAGDSYFQVSTGNMETYNYTVCYFLHFIPKDISSTSKEYSF